MLSVIAGGRDVSRSAERAPYGPALFDRLAGGVIPATNSSGCPAREYSRTGDSRRQVGVITVVDFHSQATSSRPADKPEADTLLPSVSGAYSPWQVQRPHLEPMARRA